MKKFINRIVALCAALTVVLSVAAPVCSACSEDDGISTAALSDECANDKDDERLGRRN